MGPIPKDRLAPMIPKERLLYMSFCRAVRFAHLSLSGCVQAVIIPPLTGLSWGGPCEPWEPWESPGLNQIAHVRKLTRYFSFFLICLRSLSPKEQELIADATHAFRFFFTSVPSSHWLLCAIPKDRGGAWAHYS